MAGDGSSVWQLWRQDDAGNRYLIREFASEEHALAEMQAYEDRGHKQVYWVVRATSGRQE